MNPTPDAAGYLVTGRSSADSRNARLRETLSARVQQEPVEAVVAAGKPTAVVLVNGRPLSIPWLAENASAIIEARLPGEEEAQPWPVPCSVVLIPAGCSHFRPAFRRPVPIQYNHKPSGGRSNWYVEYLESPAGPLYPFGHGLSYTAFGDADFSIAPEKAPPGGVVEIRLTVTNTGKVAGG